MKRENPNYRRDDAKLKNLTDEDHDFLWLERWKDGVEGKTHKTLAKIRMEIPLRYGFPVSMDTVSRFYNWLSYRRECAEDKAAAEQAKEEWLIKRPDATKEELMDVGDIQHLARALRRGDDQAHVRLTRSITARMKAATDKEKAMTAKMSKLEAGLEALQAEIQGSPKALKIFAELKGVVSAA